MARRLFRAWKLRTPVHAVLAVLHQRLPRVETSGSDFTSQYFFAIRKAILLPPIRGYTIPREKHQGEKLTRKTRELQPPSIGKISTTDGHR